MEVIILILSIKNLEDFVNIALRSKKKVLGKNQNYYVHVHTLLGQIFILSSIYDSNVTLLCTSYCFL